MLEPTLVEYVAVHDLAHVIRRNYSRDFWALVSSTSPDVQELRRKLPETDPTLLL